MADVIELLTRLVSRNPFETSGPEREELARLEAAAAFPFQTLDVSADDDGWTLTIRSTAADGCVEIHVPGEGRRPVAVRRDERERLSPRDYETLMEQGRYGEAAWAAELRLREADGEFNSEDVRRAPFVLNVARAYGRLGRHHRADLMYDSALRLLERTDEADPVSTTRLLREWVELQLVYFCEDETAFARTEALLNRAQSLAEAALPHTALEPSRIATCRARLRMAQLRYEEAASCLDGAAKAAAAAGGDELDFAAIELERGRLCLMHDDLANGERILRGVLELRTRLLGKDHPDVAEVLVALADLGWQSGRDDDETVALLTRGLSIWCRRLGPTHPLLRQQLERTRHIAPELTGPGAEWTTATDGIAES